VKYEPVIGMEVHVELSTKSKVFCGCSNDFHAPANSSVCPVCLGMPGVLPVLNERAVEYSVLVGLALNCSISRWSKMDRKNYFYPDLAKNYQISQYDLPLCHDGYLEIEVDGKTKRIGITRAHLEEDTARNSHTVAGRDSGVDFNRCGVPLLEIVTEPDIRSADEAYAYLTALKQILQYLDVSDCNMEEGSIRAEANISIRPVGTEPFGTKTEVKNVASFSGTQKAIEYEINRQTKVLDGGGQVDQVTMGWDADRNVTVEQRSKESAHDYRYFPEPDLTPIVVDEAWENRLRESMPELPQARRARFMADHGLSEYDASVLIAEKTTADYFEQTVAAGSPGKQAANWIMGDLQALLTDNQASINSIPMTPVHLAGMIGLIEDGSISGKIAKDLLPEMFNSGKAPGDLVKEKGLAQISDTSVLEQMGADLIAANPGPADDFRNGSDRAIGFFVGQMMKATKGQANPKLANEIMRKLLQQ
jgi:aspartyl-tRNA(Asn)/glutamyl-tRNA(Gln) amidotransferase subunit B